MDASPFRLEAQAELDLLVQGRTRQFAFGLGALSALTGALNLVLLPYPSIRLEAAFGLLSLVALGGLGLWLRHPRPPFLVNFAGGTAALLAVTTALTHLSLHRNWENTSHLMLLGAAAGFFLFSLPWFLIIASFIGLGWIGVMAAGETPGLPLHFGLELGTALLLGLLIHLVRRGLLLRFRDLLAQTHRHEAEQARLLSELQTALDKVKTLSGLIPICAQCKKIRDDGGYWQQVEDYVHDHSEAVFSHSLCPACLAAAKAEFEAYQREG
jgi:hypothetical protein